MARDYFQRENLIKGLSDILDDDIVLISDLDEIPNLQNLNLFEIKNNTYIFEQAIFYYKLNLIYDDFVWQGTRGTKYKNFISPQWLRNIKGKNYPKWRLDTFFSKKKYSNLVFIKNGGWHFSNIKTPKEIEFKLRSYLHHREFDLNPLSVTQIDEIIRNKQAIYDLRVDKTVNKIGNGSILENFELKKLPEYIVTNKNKFLDWID